MEFHPRNGREQRRSFRKRFENQIRTALRRIALDILANARHLQAHTTIKMLAYIAMAAPILAPTTHSPFTDVSIPPENWTEMRSRALCFVPPYVERIGTIPKAQIVQKSKEHLVAANRVTNAVVTDLLSSEPVTYPKAEGACIALNKILNGTGPAQIMEGEIVFAAFAMPNLKTWMDRLELDEDALTAGSGVPRDVILDVIGSGTPDRPDGARLPYTVARRLFDALKAAHAARGDAKPLFVRDLITSNKSAGDLRVPRILNRTGSKHDCILPRALIVPAPQDGHPWARGTKQEEAGWTPGSANG